MKQLILLTLLLSTTLWAIPRRIDKKTEDDNVLFIVDRSGSMAGELPRIKTAITETFKAKEKIHAGLIHFAGCGASSVSYAVPMGQGTGPKISDVVNNLEAEGATDLIEAFKKAKEVMMSQKVCINVLWFTDKMDTCSSNAEAESAAINEAMKEFCVQVNIVTYAVGQDLEGLMGIATPSGGKVYRARTEQDMINAIEDVKRRSKRTKTSFDTYDGPATSKPKTTPKVEDKPAPKPKEKPATKGQGGTTPGTEGKK